MTREEELKKNLEEVEKNIQAACKKSNRNREDITLIAVSKTMPLEDLKIIYDLGIRDFGENKVQELQFKMPALNDDINWHMIGHLQRNKVKYIAGQVEVIHSVDSYRLAEEINIQAKKKNTIIPILIEVNIAREDSKFGIYEEDVKLLVKEISELENVRIVGLMTIAPYVVDSEENRKIFHKIKGLSLDIDKEKYDNVSMDILSMGMTNDYCVAIEEGATHIRVGTAIFGKRDYSK